MSLRYTDVIAMFLLAAFLLGIIAAVGGPRVYEKVRPAKSKDEKDTLLDEFFDRASDFHEAAGGVYTEARGTFKRYAGPGIGTLRQRVHEQRHRFAVVVAESASAAGTQYHVWKRGVQGATANAQSALRDLNQNEIEPLREIIGEEWLAFTEVVTDLSKDPDKSVSNSAKVALEIIDVGASVASGTRALSRSLSRSVTSVRHSKLSVGGLRPNAVWDSLKQAKDLVFSDDRRNRDMAEFSGPVDEQLAKTEESVYQYLKVSATALATASAGAVLFPPLTLVSVGLICYAAYPAFKAAYVDMVVRRRLTIKLLDTVSFIGLVAGGYYVICSITLFIFHASVKMMLRTEDRSRQLIANMFGQQPRTVLVLVEGLEIEIPFSQLAVGDTLVVHAGHMMPIDGVISAGTAAIDQHILTGEAQPAEKGPGDRVFAATMVLAGRLEVHVEKTGAETAAAQIREILTTTSDFRTAIQARWQRVANQTVLPTLGIAGVALPVLGAGSALGVINSNYVAVMKVASPLGMLNFLQRASHAGILVKDGRALEAASVIDSVVFDKTGTLTQPEPHVGQITPFAEFTEAEVLTYAAAVEANQSHPIAQAILQAAEAMQLVLPGLDDARYEVGYGIQAKIGDHVVRVGSARYMAMESINAPAEFDARRHAAEAHGSSVVYVALGDRMAGAIELKPTLRPEAKDVVQQLKRLGLTLYIISGDHAAPTQALASELGIDHFFAEVLPQDKSRLVEELQNEGRQVCFVGDGINDAIALKKANVSVSLRGASSLATNTAQVILMDESLKQLPQLFEVAHEYEANLNTLMSTTFVPGLVSLAGIFLFGAGTGTALTIFNLSMMAGLMNAILPAIKNVEQPADKANGPIVDIRAN